MKPHIVAVILFLGFLAPFSFSQPDQSISEHAPVTPERVEEEAAEADFTITPVQGFLIVLGIGIFVGLLVTLAIRSRNREIAGKQKDGAPRS